MPEPIEYRGILWAPEPGEKANQHTTVYRGVRITVYSQAPSGLTKWWYMIECHKQPDGPCTAMHRAMAEAMAVVDYQLATDAQRRGSVVA